MLMPLLLGGAIGAAGILQGFHWRATGPSDGSATNERVRALAEENARLKRENASLRSLAQGGGELAVPQELVHRVEKELGLRYLSTPVLHRLAGEELRDRISAAIESRYGPSGIDDRQEAYKAIGWLRPDDELLAQLAAVRAVGVRGWFDDVTGDGWVTDRFDANSIPDQAALAGLLARILLHQHFPPPPAYPGDDAARAREAVHAGAAAGAEARFMAGHALANGFVPPKPNVEAGQLLKSLSPFIQGLVAFPLTEGKGFADSLYVKGAEPFLAAFRNPPQTTRAIADPTLPAAAPGVLALPEFSEEPFLIETAGWLGLRLWLQAAGDGAEEIAGSWKNDRYALFPDGQASTAVIWEIELASPGAADRLEAAALRIAATLAGGSATVRTGEVLATAEKRHLVVSRPSPVRVRFANCSEAATAARYSGR